MKVLSFEQDLHFLMHALVDTSGTLMSSFQN